MTIRRVRPREGCRLRDVDEARAATRQLSASASAWSSTNVTPRIVDGGVQVANHAGIGRATVPSAIGRFTRIGAGVDVPTVESALRPAPELSALPASRPACSCSRCIARPRHVGADGADQPPARRTRMLGTSTCVCHRAPTLTLRLRAAGTPAWARTDLRQTADLRRDRSRLPGSGRGSASRAHYIRDAAVPVRGVLRAGSRSAAWPRPFPAARMRCEPSRPASRTLARPGGGGGRRLGRSDAPPPGACALGLRSTTASFVPLRGGMLHHVHGSTSLSTRSSVSARPAGTPP